MRRLTVLHTAEVRIRALEAHVVGESLHGKSLQVVVVRVALPAQSRIFVQVFELGSFHGHLDDLLLERDFLVDDPLQFRATLAADFLLALRALQVVEDDTRPVVLLLYLSFDAVQVHDMPTIEPYRWFLTNGGAEANGAEVVNVTFGSDVLRHLLQTLRPEARQALGLTGYTTAGMTARQHLVTGLLHQLEALLLTANILKGRFHTGRGLFHFLTTEPTAG